MLFMFFPVLGLFHIFHIMETRIDVLIISTPPSKQVLKRLVDVLNHSIVFETVLAPFHFSTGY